MESAPKPLPTQRALASTANGLPPSAPAPVGVGGYYMVFLVIFMPARVFYPVFDIPFFHPPITGTQEKLNLHMKGVIFS